MKNRFSLSTFRSSNLLRGIRGGKYVVETLPSESPKLNRHIKIDLFRPSILAPDFKYPILILNDGQDAEALQLKQTLEKLWQRNEINPILVIAVTAGDRMQEYGVASEKDYAGRGAKAENYSEFVTTELIPYLKSKYAIELSEIGIVGFSLGALSAMDIAWNHPEIFKIVGAFSGSFWWRKVDAGDKTFDEIKHRIMHNQIRESETKPKLKFWFQTGTKDESSDRNGNGVIDSIDDTLDLIAELAKKGYRPFYDIVYHEVKGGEHNQHTWAQAMPYFLKWAFPAKPLN